MKRPALDAAVTRRDRLVHRCDECGDWLFAARPCVTCLALELAAAR